jgi:large subunit ribosomal protein L23
MADINSWDVLRTPRVTEKGTILAEQGKYVFEVHPEANKLQIKAAVELAFPSVKVRAVNVMTVPGKSRRWKRWNAYQSDWKKAIVTLEAGQSIELFEG